MAPLPMFPLPLLPDAPPPGYGWEEREMSILSTTTTFDTEIDHRDRFLGVNRCVICGLHVRVALHRCHIISKSEPELWEELRSRGWIPSKAKNHPEHESCNGLYMCSLHHPMFDGYLFFIRFFPDIRKFVFVNYSEEPALQHIFHGKAIALDIRDRQAPFPSLFIIHEKTEFWPAVTSAGGSSSGGRTLVLNENVIAEILAATRAMPSWKACQMEGTSDARPWIPPLQTCYTFHTR